MSEPGAIATGSGTRIGFMIPSLSLRVLTRTTDMSPKEIAAHYEAKVFDTPDAATGAGFTLTETHAPRNVWNKASAAQSLLLKLRDQKEKGEVKEIGLVLEPWRVTGCYLPNESA